MASQIETGTSPSAAPSLRRVIGVGGLAFAAFNSIVGSGIFGVPGEVAKLLGPAAILAYGVCVVLVGLVGLCFAECGSRVTGAGGLYAYASAAFGPVVGGIAGTLMWLGGCVAASAAVATFLVRTLAAFWPGLEAAVPRTLFLLAIYLVLVTVNIRGTVRGTRLSLVMALIKLTPLALLVVIGIFSIHAPNLRWTGVPAAGAVGQGAVLLFFAFMGVEGALNASGEVAQPERTVPRAILAALSLTAVLYIGLQLTAQGVLGAGLASEKAPLVATATALWGPWGGRFLIVATILSAAGYLASDLLCSPRSMYALAERGQLPRPLASVHPRFATPAVAIGSYSCLCFAAAALGTFRQLLLIASSGVLLLYLICCLGLLRLRARKIAMGGEPFHAPGGIFLPLTASAIIVWMLSTLEWKELIAAAVLVAVSGSVYGISEWMRAKRGGTGF